MKSIDSVEKQNHSWNKMKRRSVSEWDFVITMMIA